MPKNTADVFHAYDIRGTQNEGINPEFAERLGQTLAHLYTPKTVMVGLDMRSTSPQLESALIKGLTEQGVEIIRIGLCSTPMMNITMGLAGGAYDLGIMVTASHNPGEYNGFKFTDKNVLPIGQGTGMEEIRDRFLSDEAFNPSDHIGTVTDRDDALKEYLDHVFKIADLDPQELPKMKIAIDAGNGMAGHILPELIKRLPTLEIIPMFWELDGTFPNHEANPLKAETIRDLSKMVIDEHCDFGIAFDGDADRIGFVDENGEQIAGDLLTAILAKEHLHDHPGEKILRDIRSSWATEEAIAEAGGTSEFCRVGHAFIKKQMRESGALFAGELSMHFYYRDLWGVESGDLSALIMIKMLAEQKQKLSAIWKPYHRYANSGEVNTRVESSEGIIERIQSAYADQASSISDLDGIRMEFGVEKDGSKSADAWWFSVRKSNTEPLIRLIVEAKDQNLMEQKRDEILAMIK